MPTIHDLTSETCRLMAHFDEYAGCEPEFDAGYEEIDRQFAELRLHFGNQ